MRDSADMEYADFTSRAQDKASTDENSYKFYLDNFDPVRLASDGKQIRKDLHRTFQNITLPLEIRTDERRFERLHNSLSNVLCAFVARRAPGEFPPSENVYVQGMNFLAAMFLVTSLRHSQEGAMCRQEDIRSDLNAECKHNITKCNKGTDGEDDATKNSNNDNEDSDDFLEPKKHHNHINQNEWSKEHTNDTVDRFLSSKSVELHDRINFWERYATRSASKAHQPFPRPSIADSQKSVSSREMPKNHNRNSKKSSFVRTPSFPSFPDDTISTRESTTQCFSAQERVDLRIVSEDTPSSGSKDHAVNEELEFPMVEPDEETAFWLLCYLLEDVIDPHFFSVTPVALLGYQALRLILQNLTENCPWVNRLGLEPFDEVLDMLLSQWLFTLFVNSLHSSVLTVMWHEIVKTGSLRTVIAWTLGVLNYSEAQVTELIVEPMDAFIAIAQVLRTADDAHAVREYVSLVEHDLPPLESLLQELAAKKQHVITHASDPRNTVRGFLYESGEDDRELFAGSIRPIKSNRRRLHLRNPLKMFKTKAHRKMEAEFRRLSTTSNPSSSQANEEAINKIARPQKKGSRGRDKKKFPDEMFQIRLSQRRLHMKTNTWSGLQQAVAAGDATEVAKLLDDSGADVNALIETFGWNCLHIAANSGNEQCLALLLSNENVCEDTLNAKDRLNGWTPLHIAVFNGDEAIVANIVADSRASLEVKDSFRRTARDIAAESIKQCSDTYCSDIIRYLCHRKVDVDGIEVAFL